MDAKQKKAFEDWYASLPTLAHTKDYAERAYQEGVASQSAAGFSWGHGDSHYMIHGDKASVEEVMRLADEVYMKR